MAFDPDAFLAKTEPKKPGAFDPDAFLAKTASADDVPTDVSQEDSFDWGSPVYSTLKASAGAGLKGLQYVGEKLDQYSGAPTRAGLLAGIKSEQGDLIGAGKNAWEAAKSQFGEDPNLAPTGEDIVGELGMEDGIGKKVAGFGVDVLADPLNVVPVGKLSGLLGKGAKTLEKVPGFLKTFSEGQAISQSGGMLKDFRRIMQKDKLAEVGQAILKETVDVVDDFGKIKKVPVMSAGDDVEAVATKAFQKEQELGQSLGDLYRDSQEKVNKYILGDADPKVLDKLGESTPSVTSLKQEVVPEIKTALKGQAKSGPVKAVENYLDDILVDYGDKPLDLMDLHEIKSKIGKEIKWHKAEFPNRDVAFQELYKNISRKIDDHMNALDGVFKGSGEAENLATLKDLNKRYSIMTDVSTMSSDKSARNAANRMISPSDYGMGIGGLITTGNPVVGIGGAVLNKLGRGRGSGLLSRGAELGANITKDAAPVAAEGMRSLRQLDRPVVRGLLKKTKKKDEENE